MIPAIPHQLRIQLARASDPAVDARIQDKAGGDDKRWYGLRVKEFWPWMIKTYGKPTVSTAGSFSQGAISNMCGIIGFRVTFADHSATGHFTLWDGNRLLYGQGGRVDYFCDADEGALWTIDPVASY